MNILPRVWPSPDYAHGAPVAGVQGVLGGVLVLCVVAGAHRVDDDTAETGEARWLGDVRAYV